MADKGGVVVLYCRPFVCDIVALDVAAEHVPTLRDRMTRGWHPRHVWESRSSAFRKATEEEVESAGTQGWHVHAWTVLSDTDWHVDKWMVLGQEEVGQ